MSRRQSEKVWSGAIYPFQSVTAQPASNVVQATASLPSQGEFEESTIIRIVGRMRFQHPGTGGGVIGAFGLGIFPTASSPTTLPTSDPDYPWMFWQPVVLSVTSGEAGSNRSVMDFMLDIRSARVIERKTNLFLCVGLSAGSNNLSYGGGIRVLVLD